MRNVLLTKFASLIPILVLMMLSVNLYIFVSAADQLKPEEPGPAVLAAAAVVSEDSLDMDSSPLPSEQAADAVSVLEKEFGSDAASLASGSSAAAPRVEKPKQQDQTNYISYRVVKGDSLYEIARFFGTTVAALMEINELKTTTIRVNQVLLVPDNGAKEYPVGLWLTDQEVQWIAQMIHAEARGEPYLGQVAVGAVIINRVKSPKFPNTVKDVLFQDGAFQPIRNGTFYQAASEQAYRAALEALNGHDPTNGALFFFNPSISKDRFMHSRTPAITIGQHRFTY
ncbi:MAG: cell wall hydrolase [Limnochordia bacterium]|nr:cell wall hydrolase [Limnochordia bacterium]HPZ31310.1 cell wall hydrolase [Limnochordia bacterium]HQD70995.1 cell wall hydrolase [Limnochordia bacterium]